MTFIFGWLLKFLGGGILDNVLKFLQSRTDATTQREGFKRDVVIASIQAEVASRQAQSDIVRAEQGWWVTASIRPLFAIPFIIYAWKLVVYDKILGWGTTDALSGGMETWGAWIVGAYFVTRPMEKMARSYINRK